jgi:hypothetical protein
MERPKEFTPPPSPLASRNQEISVSISGFHAVVFHSILFQPAHILFPNMPGTPSTPTSSTILASDNSSDSDSDSPPQPWIREASPCGLVKARHLVLSLKAKDVMQEISCEFSQVCRHLSCFSGGLPT